MSETQNIFKYREVEGEKVHRAFFKFHYSLVAAMDELNKALMPIQMAESSRETREKALEYRKDIESMRSIVEALLDRAGKFRSSMVRENGCNGTCKD